jgi:hypothetical protein
MGERFTCHLEMLRNCGIDDSDEALNLDPVIHKLQRAKGLHAIVVKVSSEKATLRKSEIHSILRHRSLG